MAQGWNDYQEDGLYAREAEDDYDQVLAIREEAYLDGYYHGLVGRQALVKDAKKVQADSTKLKGDAAAQRAASRKENADVLNAAKDGKISAAEAKMIQKDFQGLKKVNSRVSADRKQENKDKASLRQDIKVAKRSYFDDYDFDYEY